MTFRKKIKDLNDCTVLYKIGKRDAEKRAISMYVVLHPEDPNRLVINTCTTQSLTSSITKDGLKEWLINWGQQKHPMSDSYYHLLKLVKQLPSDVKTYYDNLIHDLKYIKKIGKHYDDEGEEQGFLDDEQIATILLQGKKPILQATIIPLFNFKTILQDSMWE